MLRLKFLFDDKEEEKEKIGWAQRMRGIGELPKYELPKLGLEKAKEIEIPSTKLKFTESIITPLGLGVNAGMGIELPKDEPTWSNVIKHSLKAGLGQYQAGVVNILRLIQVGGVKATDAITNVFDPDWYDPNKDMILNALTKIVVDSEKIATESREQAESKNWLKKFIGTGLQAVPQVAGAIALGAGMPVVTGVAAVKPLAEITTRVTQMVPFGVAAAGTHAREIEKEYEELGEKVPYLKVVVGGALAGVGEMATELPIFMGLARILKGGGKTLINKGAKTLWDKYGRLGTEFIKDVGLQAWQEAEMVPIEKGIRQAVGLPQDWSIEPLVKEMGEAAYGGMAMAVVIGGLGGSVIGSAKITNKTVEAIDNVIKDKRDIKEAIRKIAETQMLIPEAPEAVTLAKEEIPKVEVKVPIIPIIKEEMIPKIRSIIDETIPKVGVKGPKLIETKAIIKSKVEKIIDEKIPRVRPKVPEIELLAETMISKVEKVVEESISKTEIKVPDIPAIKQDILSKVEKIFVEEIPKVGVKLPTEITLQRIEFEARGFNEMKVQLLKETPKSFKVWLPTEKRYHLVPKSEWQVKPEKVKPKEPIIPKELELLAEEARKYKSAEEFLDVPSKVEVAVEKTMGKSPYHFAIQYDKAIKKLNKAGFKSFKDFYNQVTKVEPKPPIEPTIKIEELKKVVEPVVREEIPKVVPKEPIKVELTEKEIVPATIEEAKEILKVDPKKPSIPKVKLAEEMVRKKVSIADIEAVKGEKIDVKKPRDIIVAIRDIKAVKEKVGIEPTPRVTPREPVVPEIPEVPIREVIEEPKVTPKVEVKEPVVPMATPEQKAEAHIIAKESKLITTTPSGKLSNVRYRRVAKAITGKASMEKMTEVGADEFIEAMKGVVQRRPWEPPIIPLSTKIVPKEFFEIEFREPTIFKYITPKDFLLREIGAEDLVKDVTEAHRLAYLEGIRINNWIDKMVKEINKKAPIGQKIKRAILAKPTDRLAKFRDLLDTYKTAPDFLSVADQKIFTQLRRFTKKMLDDTNKVRVKLGLDPIKEIEAYIPHFVDELTKQIVNKRYPFPEDVKYWIGRNMPRKIYNPTAMERKVKEELNEFFSKDLGALLRTLAKYDLRDVYLSEPYSVMRVKLNALGDKIPASVRQEIDDYMKYDIFKYPDKLDTLFNATVKVPVDVINIFLKPFGRVITNPARSISNIARRSVFLGAIWARPKLVLRNLGQRLLIMDLYPIKYYLKAQLTKMPKEDWAKIKDTTFYKISRKFEDIPEGVRKIEQWGLLPYQLSHAGNEYFSNVDVAMKTGFYYAQDMVKLSEDKNSRYYKHAERHAKKKDIPLEKLLWKEEDIIAEAVEAGSLSQWLYFTTGMPQVFRGYLKRAAFTLQSWSMNYLTKHLKESSTRTFTNRTSRGKLMRPIDRLNWLKGTAIIMGILWGLREAFDFSYERYLLPWGIVLHTNVLSPVSQILSGAFNYVTARNDWERTKALKQVESSWKIFIPGSLAWKDAKAFLNGEKSLKEYLFYLEWKGKEEPLPLKITIPKGEKLRFIKPEIKRTEKLKFTF